MNADMLNRVQVLGAAGGSAAVYAPGPYRGHAVKVTPTCWQVTRGQGGARAEFAMQGEPANAAARGLVAGVSVEGRLEFATREDAVQYLLLTP